MNAALPTQQTDSFDNSNPARGDLADAITKTGVISGVLTAGTVNAGDRVKLDNAITTPGFVGFVAAADNEAAFGVVKRTTKAAHFDSSSEDTNKIEVAFVGRQLVYECANATLVPGTAVSMNAGFTDVVGGGRVQMGITIDYAVQSQMHRVLLGFVAS